MCCQAGQNLLIQSGPESSEDDALVAIASQGSLPKHMKLGLIEMKDQERMDRYSHPLLSLGCSCSNHGESVPEPCTQCMSRSGSYEFVHQEKPSHAF